MGCRSCGKKRSSGSKHKILDGNGRIIAENVDFSRNKRRTTNNNKKTPNSTKPTMLPENYKYITTIDTKGRIDLSKHSKNTKSIYIIGQINGCGSCNYMKRLINKSLTPELYKGIEIYSLEKRQVDESSIKIKSNPTTIFVNHGKIILMVKGIKNNIGTLIRDFSMRDIKSSKSFLSEKKHVIYNLKPDPNYTEAYNKLINSLQPEIKIIQNISTFVDDQKNLLIVTVNYK